MRSRPSGRTRAHQPAKVTPPVPEGAIPRRRLFSALDRLRRQAPAIWLSGEPGSGKTTLVATWLAHPRRRPVWLRVDAADAEVATFFHYLAVAVRAATGRPVALPAFTPEYLPDLDAFSRMFFRRLAERLRPGTVIVLDDCHAIPPEAAFFGALRAGVEELTAEVTLVLVSRGDPPPALARARAHGELAVLPAGALALTTAESLALARARGVGAGRARVEALRQAVRGWAAGLSLMLARGEAPGASPLSSTAEYFASEVLDRVEPASRRVLLEVALLEAPTAELVQRATGNAEASRVLAALARRGLFTVRHDGPRPAFELHGLFREFLVERGREELPPGRADEVRCAAAGALAGGGPAGAEAAIALLAEARAFTQMAGLVRGVAGALLRDGRAQTVARWIEALPEEVRRGDPWLLHWDGVAILPFEPGSARERLREALAAFEARGEATGAWLSWAAIVESVVFEWKDFVVLGAALADHDRLATRFPFPSPEVEARVAVAAFTAASLHRPDHPSYAAWAQVVRGLALSAPDPVLRLQAGALLVSHEALVLGTVGPNRPVVAALDPIARDPETPAAPSSLWLSAVGTFHIVAGDLDACAASAADALEASRRHGLRAWDFVSRMLEASVSISRDAGDVPERVVAAERAVRPDSRVDLANLRVVQGFAALRAGRAAAAVALGEEGLTRARAAGYTMPAVLALLLLARARAKAGDVAGAERALGALQQIDAAVGSLRARCFAAFIEADLRPDGAERTAALGRAFRLARESGAPPLLIFSRAELADLAAAALVLGVAEEDVRAFVVARGLEPPAALAAPERWPWPLRIRLLGGFEVERNGAPWSAGRGATRKPVELVQALAALGARDVPEHAVAEALWPDSDGDAAQHALETTLYRLRRTLGTELVVQRQRRLSLAPGRCGVDALHLQERLRASLAHLARPEARRGGRARADAAAVVALYRGPLLPEVGAAWAIEARDRLRRQIERWLRALEALPGDPGDSSGARRALVAADPALQAPPSLRLA
jgi:ATP/maltotriose-dependent transcriptional regulator MalT